MSAKLITLKTNHTLLGDIDCTKENEVVVKKPVQVIMQPTKEGPMMAFAPFLDYAEEFTTGIELYKSDILCVTTPNRELANQYSKMFGSGIEIASAIPKVVI
jgi:hypothetical protein